MKQDNEQPHKDKGGGGQKFGLNIYKRPHLSIEQCYRVYPVYCGTPHTSVARDRKTQPTARQTASQRYGHHPGGCSVRVCEFTIVVCVYTAEQRRTQDKTQTSNVRQQADKRPRTGDAMPHATAVLHDAIVRNHTERNEQPRVGPIEKASVERRLLLSGRQQTERQPRKN